MTVHLSPEQSTGAAAPEHPAVPRRRRDRNLILGYLVVVVLLFLATAATAWVVT